MAFFTVGGAGGFEVDLLYGEVDEKIEAVGFSKRGFNGSLTSSRRASKLRIAGTTNILTAAERTALIGLLRGDGHVWEYADEYSSRGLGASSGAYTLGSGKITVTSGSTVVYPVGYSGDWTVRCRYNPASADDYYTLDSAGTKYKNGSTTADSVDNVIEVVAGSLRLYGQNIAGASTDMDFDSVAVVPYVMTADMHAAFSDGSVDFDETPDLTVLLPDGEERVMRLVLGSIKVDPEIYVNGSTLVGFKVSFELEEV
jgi:hypothetical protein